MRKSAPDKSAVEEMTVWLVEDNDRFRSSIEDLINETGGLTCVLAAQSCEEALVHLETDAAPDVMLMDIGLPGLDGIEGIRKVKSIAPSIQVIMLTVFDENEKIFQAICAGASGYLLKSSPPDKIIESLKEILTGGAPVNAHIARKMLDMFAHFGAPKGGVRNYPGRKRNPAPSGGGRAEETDRPPARAQLPHRRYTPQKHLCQTSGPQQKRSRGKDSEREAVIDGRDVACNVSTPFVSYRPPPGNHHTPFTLSEDSIF